MNPRNIRHGAVAGIAGGIVFGAMMAMMGMLPMIGQMVGSPTAGAGFLAHLVISALIGASFGLIFHSRVRGTGSGFGYGALYGGVWWILGPLTLMPLMMGMGLGVNWNGAAAAAMLPSLAGHLIYGLILGCTFAWLGHLARISHEWCPRLHLGEGKGVGSWLAGAKMPTELRKWAWMTGVAGNGEVKSDYRDSYPDRRREGWDV